MDTCTVVPQVVEHILPQPLVLAFHMSIWDRVLSLWVGVALVYHVLKHRSRVGRHLAHIATLPVASWLSAASVRDAFSACVGVYGLRASGSAPSVSVFSLLAQLATLPELVQV